MSKDLYSAIARAAASRGQAACLVDDRRAIAYSKLDARTARFANTLRGLGVRRGDRVAAQIDKSVDNILLYLACLRAGAVYLPLSTAYTPGELDYFIADSEPALVVGSPERRDAIAALPSAAGTPVETMANDGTGSLIDETARCADRFAAPDIGPHDVAAILYTSGTTGRPKGAMLSHGNLLSNARVLIETWGLNAEDVLLHALPTYHAHGLFVAINTSLLAGMRILLRPRFSTEDVIALLPQSTVMMGVPTFYSRLLAEPAFDRRACRTMRLFISGSAPLLEETFRGFEKRTGFAILERYGMTETGMNCSNPLHGERRAGSVGPPLPGIEVRVVDEAGSAVSPGEAGMLEVRGANVFKGYWRQPDKTAEELRPDGFLITGDLARIDEDGYVHIVGRAKDLIISGGYNVYPKEVEGVLDAQRGILESAVIGVPHPDFGEGVIAVAVADTRQEPDAGAILQQAKRELAAYKVPKKLYFVEALPRNAMGKVQKSLLRERFAGAFSS